MSANDAAELLVRAAKVRTMDPDRQARRRQLAIPRRRSTGRCRAGRRRELLEAGRGPDTVMLDAAGLVVMPAFVDTHNHLRRAARDAIAVPVSQARDIPRIVDRHPRARTARNPGWPVDRHHRNGLAPKCSSPSRRRLPTAKKLDQATSDHQVLLLRGGHNAVLNTAALRVAGIGPDFADVAGGFIARDAAGHPSGWVRDAALRR